MGNFIARIISNVFNPFLVLLPMPYFLVDKVANNDVYAFKWAMFSYVFMSIVGLFVVFGVILGIFSDMDVSKREERPLLFAFIGIVSILYLVFLIIFNAPKVLLLAIFALSLGLVLLAIVNSKIKASAHVATMSSIISSVAIIYGGVFLFAFSLIPIIAWARVKTKRHTPLEAITGSILGILLTIIVYIIAKRFI
jgi:membrane-associated phospholipid phosphatase